MTRKYECIKRFSWTPDRLFLLNKLSKEVTMSEAANIIGCCLFTIKKGCREHGISFQKHGEKHHNARHSNHDIELCRQLDDEGMPIKEISEKMEIPYTIVLRAVRFRERLNG